jgi:hypothetical protein
MSKRSSQPLTQCRLLPLVACLAVAFSNAAPARDQRAGRSLGRFDGLEASWIGDALPASRTRLQGGITSKALSHTGATISVNNCNDNGAGSLRAAVASAHSGDTVDLGKLRCATITLTSGAITTALDDLTITGPGKSNVVIDGNSSDRVLNHDGSGTLSVSHVTLTHGHATDASVGPAARGGFVFGGCLNSAGSIVLDHAAIVACDASSATDSAYGGGAYARGTATIVSSIVAANTVHAARHAVGGGVLADYGMTVRNSTISANATIAIGTDSLPPGSSIDASMGGLGSIYNLDMSDSLVQGNTVSASTAFADQVAVANEAGVMAFYTLTMVRSTISDNAAQAINTASSATAYTYAYSVGGGARAASFVVSDSTISGNSTSAIASNSQYVGIEGSSGGGAKTFTQNGTVSFTNSTISGNTSTRSASAYYARGYALGGGIFANGVALNLSNSTVAFNTAEQGSGVYQYKSADIRMDSTIIAGNTSSVGGADFSTHQTETVAGANNLITSVSANVSVPLDTLSTDPMLAPLANNGGPTLTHALLPHSPAIDAGSNAAALMFDQRGNGHPRVAGVAPDIGAFEVKQ